MRRRGRTVVDAAMAGCWSGECSPRSIAEVSSGRMMPSVKPRRATQACLSGGAGSQSGQASPRLNERRQEISLGAVRQWQLGDSALGPESSLPDTMYFFNLCYVWVLQDSERTSLLQQALTSDIADIDTRATSVMGMARWACRMVGATRADDASQQLPRRVRASQARARRLLSTSCRPDTFVESKRPAYSSVDGILTLTQPGALTLWVKPSHRARIASCSADRDLGA
jgi:hypothetical protein